MVIRKKIALLLLFLIVNSTIAAYAFWDDIYRDRTDIDIPLSERGVLVLSETINPDKKLVPLGAFCTAEEIDEYRFTYTATFNKEGQLNVSILAGSIRIGEGNHDFNQLAVMQIYGETEPLDNEAVLEYQQDFMQWNEVTRLYTLSIHIRVFLTRPSDETDYDAAYDAIKNQSLSFTVSFEALKKTEN